jgi:PhnB protein
MPTTVEPYLMYPGTAADACAYYEKTLGAKVLAIMRYAEAPDDGWKQHISEKHGNKVMHALIQLGHSKFMLADDMAPTAQKEFKGFTLTLSQDDPAATEHTFNTMVADGGTPIMPLAATFFAKKFGMVTDKFGVAWGLITPAEM